MLKNRANQVILIGQFQENLTLLQALKQVYLIEIVAVIDPESLIDGVHIGDSKIIPIYQDVDQCLDNKQLSYNMLLDTIGLDHKDLYKFNRPSENVTIIKKEQIEFCQPFIQKLLEAVQQQQWTDAVMEAAQEGIQVVDGKGKILYANASFKRILGVPLEERIGKNVYDVSPDGSLAYVLSTGKAVFGNTHITNGVPIVANASPIINEGQLVGAVTVFNNASSIEKMAKILKKNRDEIDSLRAEIHKMNRPKYSFFDMAGESQILQNCLRQAKQAADSNSTVLITGESGTGKELFAHSIHEFGQRSKEPFIKINCPAIPSTLLESELFGYEKGAFTGAAKSKIGKFELANGGTIFLDEIGDLDLILQAKLLRVLQEREVERVGGDHPIQVDVRVIAVTNQNLPELIDKGLFRKDLFYRLNVIHIHVPPLRERLEDIPILTIQMLAKASIDNQPPKIENSALEELYNYNWPGNVRELENLIEKLMIFSDCRLITKEDIMYGLYADNAVQLHEITNHSLATMEKKMILAALERYGNTLLGKKAAARELGISLTCLYDKIKKFRRLN